MTTINSLIAKLYRCVDNITNVEVRVKLPNGSLRTVADVTCEKSEAIITLNEAPEPRYNLVVHGDYALENATMRAIEIYMGENGIHKDDCSLEEL